jgi:hypothetical protein
MKYFRLCALLVPMAVGGCVALDNGRIDASVIPDDRPARSLPTDAPSIHSLDRSNWRQTTYVIHPWPVAHSPAYRPDRSRLNNTRRQRGEYPTAESAFDIGEGQNRPMRREAITVPPLAFVDALLILPRMAFEQRPRSVDSSPQGVYERDAERRWNASLTHAGQNP